MRWKRGPVPEEGTRRFLRRWKRCSWRYVSGFAAVAEFCGASRFFLHYWSGTVGRNAEPLLHVHRSSLPPSPVFSRFFGPSSVIIMR